MGWFLPALALAGKGLAVAGSGAMGALSSKLGMSKEKKQEPLMTPEQKAQASASQALIPFYLQMISGQMPDFLKRYLQQTRGTLEMKNRQSISDYLRQVGGAGMDFGPQQAAALGNMYQGMTPALTEALGKARMELTGGALKGLQSWSEMRPEFAAPPAKQPSYGMSAGSGALGAIAPMLGGLKTGTAGNNPKVSYPGSPVSQAGAQDWIKQAYQSMGQNQFPSVPQSLYPSWAK